MKTIQILVIILVVATATGAHALQTKDLLSDCWQAEKVTETELQGNAEGAGLCVGYVAGCASVTSSDISVTDDSKGKVYDVKLSSVSIAAIIRAFILYGDVHPEKWEQDAGTTLVSATIENGMLQVTEHKHPLVTAEN